MLQFLPFYSKWASPSQAPHIGDVASLRSFLLQNCTDLEAFPPFYSASWLGKLYYLLVFAPLHIQGDLFYPPTSIPFHTGIDFIVYFTSYFKNGIIIMFQVAMANWEHHSPPCSKVAYPQATVKKDAARSSPPPKWYPHLVDSSIQSVILWWLCFLTSSLLCPRLLLATRSNDHHHQL